MKHPLVDHLFPLRVSYQGDDGKMKLWSRHKSPAAAERAYREAIRDMPEKNIEISDQKTGERKRYGSEKWRAGHRWNEPWNKIDQHWLNRI